MLLLAEEIRAPACKAWNLLLLVYWTIAFIKHVDFVAVQEEAAVEFVNQIGDHAQAQLEDEWEKKTETLMAEVMVQQIPTTGEPTGYKADVPVASSLPRESSQEPSVVLKTRTIVVEARVTPPKG